MYRWVGSLLAILELLTLPTVAGIAPGALWDTGWAARMTPLAWCAAAPAWYSPWRYCRRASSSRATGFASLLTNGGNPQRALAAPCRTNGPCAWRRPSWYSLANGPR